MSFGGSKKVFEATQLFETASGCGSYPVGNCFFLQTRVFVVVSSYRLSVYFCRLSYRTPTFSEGSALFQVVVTSKLETKKPGNSIPIETCFFLQI